MRHIIASTHSTRLWQKLFQKRAHVPLDTGLERYLYPRDKNLSEDWLFHLETFQENVIVVLKPRVETEKTELPKSSE